MPIHDFMKCCIPEAAKHRLTCVRYLTDKHVKKKAVDRKIAPIDANHIIHTKTPSASILACWDFHHSQSEDYDYVVISGSEL